MIPAEIATYFSDSLSWLMSALKPFLLAPLRQQMALQSQSVLAPSPNNSSIFTSFPFVISVFSEVKNFRARLS
jgi:hypothetical protein